MHNHSPSYSDVACPCLSISQSIARRLIITLRRRNWSWLTPKRPITVPIFEALTWTDLRIASSADSSPTSDPHPAICLCTIFESQDDPLFLIYPRLESKHTADQTLPPPTASTTVCDINPPLTLTSRGRVTPSTTPTESCATLPCSVSAVPAIHPSCRPSLAAPAASHLHSF